MRTFKLLLIVGLTVFMTVNSFAGAAKTRSDIPDKYKWRTADIYPNVDAWQKDYDFIQQNLDALASYKGKFAGPEAKDPAKALIEFNKLSETINAKFEKVWIYTARNYHVDMANSQWKGMLQKCQILGIDYGDKLAWVNPELLTIPQAAMHKYIEANPELEAYRKSYDDLYLQQEHVLSEPEEKILALSGNITGTASDVFGTFTDTDMRFGYIVDENGDSVEVTDSGWVTWRTNKDRRVREDYFKAIWNTYNQYGNTFAALMNGNIMKDVYLTKARGYENTLDRALSGDFIPTYVYENLVNTTRANEKPLHKYNELRKKGLGLDHYRHWDYYVSMINYEDDKRYSWEDGVKMVVQYLAPMGEKYVADITWALDPKNGCVDPFTHKAKCGGAYSGGCYSVHGYMLFNFDYEKGLDLNDISTVAHEVGHSMHSTYSEKKQPMVNKDYAIFNAEVASTVNEAIMSLQQIDEARKEYDKVKKNKSSKDAVKKTEYEKARTKLMFLLESQVDAVRQTYYRQTKFAAWEWEAHKKGENGEPLTKESLDKLYYDLVSEFHGPALEYEELSGSSWSHIPHFYRGYYVFSYATSYAASFALAQDIIGEWKGDKTKAGARERFLNFLASGSSQHPVELLKDAGVDLSTPAPFLSLINACDKWVDELTLLWNE